MGNVDSCISRHNNKSDLLQYLFILKWNEHTYISVNWWITTGILYSAAPLALIFVCIALQAPLGSDSVKLRSHVLTGHDVCSTKGSEVVKETISRLWWPILLFIVISPHHLLDLFIKWTHCMECPTFESYVKKPCVDKWNSKSESSLLLSLWFIIDIRWPTSCSPPVPCNILTRCCQPTFDTAEFTDSLVCTQKKPRSLGLLFQIASGEKRFHQQLL